MTGHDTRVSRADIADMDGILELQAANQTARGGALAASLTGERLAKMMQDMPLIVARRDGRITGFLLTTSREVNADIPIVKAMFNAYHGAPDAYVYGPICVGEQERGKGLAQIMFAELRRLEPGREGILFIRNDNEASLRAHLKMGMKKVASFEFNSFAYAVFCYIG
ncbi:GNAT family N-acetyltransferase [Pseudomonas sp. TWR2-1-1]|uniref:GNAT family N-acetyltransferase n=1 Tax=Pseudomonas sp. TWR2-1-1 TaxID=2804610 RepID=UPI003CF1634E